jgi:hypothetical protein
LVTSYLSVKEETKEHLLLSLFIQVDYVHLSFEESAIYGVLRWSVEMNLYNFEQVMAIGSTININITLEEVNLVRVNIIIEIRLV